MVQKAHSLRSTVLFQSRSIRLLLSSTWDSREFTVSRARPAEPSSSSLPVPRGFALSEIRFLYHHHWCLRPFPARGRGGGGTFHAHLYSPRAARSISGSVETKVGMGSKGLNSTYSFSVEEEDPNLSPFLCKLFKEWDDRKARGLFHHNIAACDTKVLPGEHNFVATLIEGRDQKKRPTEFGMNQVLQPFDSGKFNFTKVSPEEVIFRFQGAEDDSAQYFDGASHAVSGSPSAILINMSPIGYCHVLLIPRIEYCLPQRVDKESFLLAMYVAREARSPFFRVGYNSLGGFATINHLHFQAYYLKLQYPIEKAPIEELTVLGNGVKILQLAHYPVNGFVFEGGTSLEDLSDVVSNACILLQQNNRPFNALVSESGKRVFLLPQCYAEKQALGKASQEFLDMRINPAIWELSGHLVLKRRKDYNEASEGSLCRFLTETSLSGIDFQELKSTVLEFLASASPEA